MALEPLTIHDTSLAEGITVSAADTFITSLLTAGGPETVAFAADQSLGFFSVNGVVQGSEGFVRVPVSELNTVTFTTASTAETGFFEVVLFDASDNSVGGAQAVLVTSPHGDAPITIHSQSGWDFQAGGSADQTFVSSSRDNGLDTITMPDPFADYTIAKQSDGSVVLTDSHGPSTTIQGIEEVHFSNTTKFIEGADNANIARLYSAAFDRVPDLEGLAFWEHVYATSVPASAKAAGYYIALSQTDDGSGTSIAGNFMQSSEFTTKYGNLSNIGFVDAMYHNVLGRGADTAGASFWLDQLSHGTTRDMVLVGFAESPENVAKTGGDWLLQV